MNIKILSIVAGTASAGYIFEETDAIPSKMPGDTPIEVPEVAVCSEDQMTTYYDVAGGPAQAGKVDNAGATGDNQVYPLAAKFGWDGHLGVLDCHRPSSGRSTWVRLVQFKSPRDDAQNPATNCTPSEGVDCINWMQPETLQAMCESLLLQREDLLQGR